MLDFILLCAAILLGYGCSILILLRTAHMFQLNSYRVATHFLWMRRKPSDWLLSLAALLPGGICLLPKPSQGWRFLFAAVCFALLAAAFRPRKAKKKLVFTARMIRLIGTVLLFGMVSAGGMFFLPTSWRVLMPALFCALLPWITPFASFLNAPMEAAVRRWYICDAKKILQSCPKLTVIGITGSYGKTSVKYFLTALLRTRYHVLMTPESYNTPMGVVKTIRGDLRATHEIFVCEMGAKYLHDIRELCDIVHPKHGMITSIGPQHLETFHSMEHIISTKLELAEALPEDGLLFANTDCQLLKEHLPNRNCISYGTGDGACYRAEDMRVSWHGTDFTVVAPKEETCDFHTKLIGSHNVINLLGAIAASHQLGIPLRDLRPAVSRLESVPHRLQLLDRGQMTIIDDAYNSNPSGAAAALETFALFDACRILITPGMVELGDQQEAYNQKFGVQAAAVCHFVILVGAKQTLPIYHGLRDAGYPSEQIAVVENIHQAMQAAWDVKTTLRKVVLLENDLPDNY